MPIIVSPPLLKVLNDGKYRIENLSNRAFANKDWSSLEEPPGVTHSPVRNRLAGRAKSALDSGFCVECRGARESENESVPFLLGFAAAPDGDPVAACAFAPVERGIGQCDEFIGRY